jgi:ATP-dependent RNA helicase RhlE
LRQPIEISVTPRNAAANTVEQWVCPVDKKRKSALLAFLIEDQQWEQVLVFSRTKHGANRLARYLDERGINAAAIHGNKSQGARTKALANFKSGNIRVLVATDIAARGLDIHQLPQVVNVDLPQVAEDYVHRIGRTGRAGATGQAISLVSADEFKQLAAIERLVKRKFERKLIDGFEPGHDVPASSDSVNTKKPATHHKPRTAKKPNHHSQNQPNNKKPNSRRRKAKPAATTTPAKATTKKNYYRKKPSR